MSAGFIGGSIGLFIGILLILRFGVNKAILILLGIILVPVAILAIAAYSGPIGGILFFIAIIAIVAALMYAVVWFLTS